MNATWQDNGRITMKTCDLIRAEIFHPDLSISDDYVLGLLKLEVRDDEYRYWHFDFKEVYLPPNSIYTRPRKIVDEARLMTAVILVVQEYLRRSKNSKSRTDRAAFTLQVALQFIEFIWLNDILDLQSVKTRHIAKLPELLATSGWWGALRILERAENLAGDQLTKLLSIASPSEEFRGKYVPQAELQAALGTCCHNTTAFLRSAVRKNNGPQSPLKTRDQRRLLSARTITNQLGVINIFFDIDGEYGLKILPFHNPAMIASRYGRPPERTKNLQVDVAAKLLAEAARWIYCHGPVVADLLDIVSAEVAECRSMHRKYMGRRLRKFFDELGERAATTKDFPFPIQYLDFGRRDPKGKNSLREALLCVLTSCFVVIASMNARRKDEILHKKFGLQRDSLRTLNDELGLYQVDFYVEKTYRRRVPFYVNRITADAIKLLMRIESAFNMIDSLVPPKEGQAAILSDRPLFAYRRFSVMKGVGNERKWYGFTTYSHDSDAARFVKLALGGDLNIPVSAHMFRRMYALVFYYQYENSDIQALMFQMGHFGLGSTLVYITDPASRPENERISELLEVRRVEDQSARKNHFDLIQEELDVVGHEKQIADVYAILNGHSFSGGYVKYIRRIQTRLAGMVEFPSDLKGKATAVVASLRQRGHFPRPMPHGQCMAGRTLSTHLAKCAPKEGDKIRQENASASTCGSCIFHLTSAAYIENVERDARALEERMSAAPAGSLVKQRLEIDVSNLRAALELLKKRV